MQRVHFILFLLAFPIACSYDHRSNGVSTVDAPQPASEVTIYAEFVIDHWVLNLKGVNGYCTLEYKPADGRRGGRTIDFPMEAQCQFRRTGHNFERPQYYTFGKDTNRRTVLLISGAPPHPTARDDLFPNGCGTRSIRVRLFRDRVEADEMIGYYGLPGQNYEPTPFCSGPTDQVDF